VAARKRKSRSGFGESKSLPSATLSASEELIAERRAESAKDAEETTRWLRSHKKRSR
jgi:hypothetical protein